MGKFSALCVEGARNAFNPPYIPEKVQSEKSGWMVTIREYKE